MARILVDRNPWRSYKFNWDLHIWKSRLFKCRSGSDLWHWGSPTFYAQSIPFWPYGFLRLGWKNCRILPSCEGGFPGEKLHEFFRTKKGRYLTGKNRCFFLAHQQKRWVPTQLEVIDGEFLLAHLQPSDFKDALQTQHLAHSIEVGLLGAKFYVKVDIFQPRYLKIYMVGLHGQCGNSHVCISPLGVMALGLYISWHFGRYILYVVLNTSRFLRETWDSRVVRGPIS